jgi:hypothetical protein
MFPFPTSTVAVMQGAATLNAYRGQGVYPYNATFLALRLSALTMCEIRLVIAPLHPRDERQHFFTRISP